MNSEPSPFFLISIDRSRATTVSGVFDLLGRRTPAVSTLSPNDIGTAGSRRISSPPPNVAKVLESLPDQPGIKSSPDVQKEVREAVTQIQGLRGMAKTATGIDPVTDVFDATTFAQFVPGQSDPSAIVVVHGNFSSLDKLAGT